MAPNSHAELKQTLGLPLVTFYGLGTIVGAGIYVLIGEVANIAGQQMLWSFLFAGVIAALTGACYAELSSRYPHAAGAVLYVDSAFNKTTLSQITGFLLLLTGIVSAATISRGFAGYLNLYIQINADIAAALLCLGLGLIACRGIREAAWLVAFITLLEIFGLLLVIFIAAGDPAHIQELPIEPPKGLGVIILGTFLAFYAFIGFEDMVNLAEEMQSARRDMPKALLLAIGISTLLYTLIALIAVRYTDLDGLAASASPLTFMLGKHETAVLILGVISLVAITNGALTQIIMASRVLYGMAKRDIIPAVFARINATTQTPIISTLLITAAVLLFALLLPLVALAKLTSAIILVIFALVNLSLIRIKLRPQNNEGSHYEIPILIPVLALIINLGLLTYQLLHF